MAVTAYVSPNAGDAGACEVKATVCAALATATVWLTVGAARWSSSPAWSASSRQVPAWRKVTVEPSRLQAALVVPASTEKSTGPPEVLVADRS